MDLYVIRRPSAWANLAELEAAGAKSAKIGNEEMLDLVRHRYLSDILLCERMERGDLINEYLAGGP